MLDRLRRVRTVLRKPPDRRSLSEKILVSSALTGIDHAVNLVFRLGATLVVTRLLAPDIFGLFAVITMFQVLLVMITDFGIRSLIIVSDDVDDPDFLQTCWSVQIVRGVLLWGALLALALGLYGLQQAGLVPAGIAYADPVLPAALAVSGLQIPIRALESVNQHVHARQMRLGRITLLGVIRSVVTPALTIAIALVSPTVWALVFSGLVSMILSLVLSFTLFPGPPMRFRWHRGHARELFGRGKWIMSSSALTAATNQADQLVLGAFLPASLLGTYFLAKQIFQVVPGLVRKLHGSIGLQIFREIGTDTDDLAGIRRRYYRYRAPIDVLLALAAGALLALGPALIDLMYDPRYAAAGTILQVLAIGLPLTGIGMIHAAFAARKRFRFITGVVVVQLVTIWAWLVVALAVFASPEAAFLGIALYRLPELAIVLTAARREGWVDLWREIRFLPLVGVGALAGWGLGALYFSLTGA